MQQTLLIPFHSNIILEPTEARAQTESGILLPEAYRVPANQGKVVDIGPTVSDKIKLGDILFFPQHSETRLDYRGKKFIVIDEAQVLGAIRVEEKQK